MNDVDVVEWEERPMRELTLSQLQQEAYRVAVARGQWPRGCRATAAVPSVLATVARRALGEEATELGAALSRLGASAPLDPVADELADVVIVCASIAEALGIDLERAVRAKMRRNEERARACSRAKRHSEEGGDDRLTPERLSELRRIAQMATPGPWERDGRIVYALTHYGYRNGIEQRANKVTISVQKGHDCSAEEADAVALHIATFDPRMVLALLDEIERLRRERTEIADTVTRFELYDPDLNAWECQACRFWWEFEDGDPYDHDMRFCPRCGRRIVREAQHLAGAPAQA